MLFNATGYAERSTLNLKKNRMLKIDKASYMMHIILYVNVSVSLV